MRNLVLIFAASMSSALSVSAQATVYLPAPPPAGIGSATGTSRQQPPDPKKEAERIARQAALADAAVTDTAGLRLVESRAVVYARAGALTWKTSQKDASGLFQRAVNELANSLTMPDPEASKQNQANLEMRINQTVRPQVLNQIANYDPEFALDAMYRTRSASVQRALAGDPSGKITDTGSMNSSLARTEMALEQHLTMMAAEKNPERAIKMLQDSLKKGVSNETLNLLKKLYSKDPDSATSFAADALNSLQAATFSTEPGDYDNVNAATAILQYSMQPQKPGSKELKFDDSSLRSLALKLINFTLTQDYRMNPARYSQMMPIAEKYAPASVAALKKVQSTMPASMRAAFDTDLRKMISDPKITPADMVNQAKNMAVDVRPTIFQNAASKMANTGDINSALQLLNANFSGTALENAINSANYTYANYLVGQGRYAEAEQLIDSFPDIGNKRMALINLANRAFAKNPTDNKDVAISALTKARGTLPERPSDNGELNQITQLVNAYASIDADQAFGLYESLIPQMNELADANALVQGFQSFSGSVRSGEFMINQYGSSYGFQLDPNVFRSLAKADFDRTQKLIDSFARREIRISLRLQLAETGLNQQ